MEGMDLTRIFIIIFLFLTLLNFGGSAQSTNIDSLRNTLITAEVDSTKIEILSKLQNYWIEKNSDSSVYYGKILATLALKNRDEYAYFLSNIYVAYSYGNKGLYDSSITTIHHALKQPFIGENLNYKANYLNLLGEMSRASGQLDAAIKYLKEASIINIGQNDTMYHAQVYNRLAAIYFEKEMFSTSKVYVDSSNLFLKTTINPALEVNNLELLGAIYRETGEYDKALANLLPALEISRKINNLAGIPNLLNNLAITYYNLHKYDDAISAAVEAFTISEQKDLKAVQAVSALWLGKAYGEKNDFANAFKYSNIHIELYEDLNKKEKDQLIADYNTKYETEKKQRQIDEQIFQIDKERTQNQALIIGLVVFSILIGFLILFLLKIRRFNTILSKQKAEIENQSIELMHTNDKLNELTEFKDNMTGMIVHDLKAPLNMILSAKPEKEKDQYVKIIHHHARSIRILVSNMLDVSKYEKSQMNLCLREIPIEGTIAKVANDFALLIGKKSIHFTTEIQQGLMANADKNILKRILTNLISNALKFSPPNGEIRVSATKSSEYEITISVSDQGDGIYPENLELIFKKFAQVEKRKLGITESTGLGLTFCKMAVEAHGGKIGVESEPGNGSKFWFTMGFAGFGQIMNADKLQSNQNRSFNFTEDEVKLILPLLNDLHKCRIFEISKIHEIINLVHQSENPEIKKWSKAIINAANTNNTDLFKHLTCRDIYV